MESEIKWRIERRLPRDTGFPFAVYDVLGAYWSPIESAWMSQGRLRYCGCRTMREARTALRRLQAENPDNHVTV